MLVNNTDMSLRGPLVRQITAEILHHAKIFLHNLHGQFVGDHFFIASLKAFTDSFCFTSSGISSHILIPIIYRVN